MRTSASTTNSAHALVWDLPVRLAHWGLTLTLAGSWLTAELGVEYREYHFWCGYAALAILLFRLMWGLVGSRYARFAEFLPSPARVVGYVRQQFSGQTPTPAGPGHNPLGALALVVMLGLIGVQITSGLFADDDILYTGPYQSAVSEATVKWFTNLHHSNVDYLLAMIVLHLLAIGFYQFARGQRLTRAMITGRKPIAEFAANPPIPHTAWLRGLVVFAIAVALVALLLYLAPEPVYDDYYY